MKKILISTMLLLPTIVLAGLEPTASPFPEAKKGINIWPMEKINMPMKKDTIMAIKSFATKGYSETNETDEFVKSLLNMPRMASKETAIYDKSDDQTDTHLRSSASKFKMTFRFSGIPGIPKNDILGFSPAGGYKNDKGWDGMGEFVRIPDIGICSFTTMAIERVILFKEALQYEVNNKPSDKNIAGNFRGGFIYTVNWYTDTRRNSFQCASKNLKPENLKKMVRIANEIDKTVG